MKRRSFLKTMAGTIAFIPCFKALSLESKKNSAMETGLNEEDFPVLMRANLKHRKQEDRFTSIPDCFLPSKILSGGTARAESPEQFEYFARHGYEIDRAALDWSRRMRKAALAIQEEASHV